MVLLEYFLPSFIAVLLIVLVESLWRKRWWYYHSLAYQGPISFPLIGNISGMFRFGWDFLNYSCALFEQYPDLFRVWLGGKLVIVSRRPNDINLISKEFADKDPTLYGPISSVTGDSILTARVNRWKRHRKVAAPAMTKKAVNEFVEIFGTLSDELVKNLTPFCGKGEFKADLYVLANNFRASCATFLDIYFDSNEEILNSVTYVTRALHSTAARIVWGNLGFLSLWKMTTPGIEFGKLINNLRGYVTVIFISKKDKLQKIEDDFYTPGDRVTFMHKLLETMKKDESWSDEELVEICLTMTGVGSDTSATSLCYTFMALAIHQDVQEEAYQEQQRIFGNSDRNPTVEDLREMTYLERVLNESMRMFPPAPIMAKLITHDVKLDDDYVVPKGSTFAINIMAAHRNPKYWNDPLKFDPDRFLPEECLKRPNGVFIPFSLGPRNCVGLHYGMVNMKVFASKMIRNFKITTSVKSLLDLDLHFEVVVKIVDGCKIALEPRA